jgi:hypothetical protein
MIEFDISQFIPYIIGILGGIALGSILLAQPRKNAWNIAPVKPYENVNLWAELDKIELRAQANNQASYKGQGIINIDNKEISYPGKKQKRQESENRA